MGCRGRAAGAPIGGTWGGVAGPWEGRPLRSTGTTRYRALKEGEGGGESPSTRGGRAEWGGEGRTRWEAEPDGPSLCAGMPGIRGGGVERARGGEGGAG